MRGVEEGRVDGGGVERDGAQAVGHRRPHPRVDGGTRRQVPWRRMGGHASAARAGPMGRGEDGRPVGAGGEAREEGALHGAARSDAVDDAREVEAVVEAGEEGDACRERLGRRRRVVGAEGGEGGGEGGRRARDGGEEGREGGVVASGLHGGKGVGR